MRTPTSSPALNLPPDADVEEERPWTKIIRAQTGYFSFPWREFWSYRDLTRMLAVRDISTSYKQTVLGPLWFVLQPLMITVVFSYLFGRMARFGTDDVPHYLFYMGGLVAWGFFSETVTKTSTVFNSNANLFSKVYFPRLCVPVAGVLSNLVPLGVQFLLFFGGWIYYLAQGNAFVNPNWTIILTPLLFVQVAALALGLGCIVSALTRRFRDLGFGVKVGMQLWMFGSAIVFPLSRIPEDDRWIFFLNPMVPPIEAFRYAFTGASLVEPWHLAVSAATSLLVLLIGMALFERAEKTAMDTV